VKTLWYLVRELENPSATREEKALMLLKLRAIDDFGVYWIWLKCGKVY
jgi:hypothetical protein